MTIRVIYHDREPGFPATDQHPDAARYVVHSDFLGRAIAVDAIGGEPSTAAVDAILNPPPRPTEAQRLVALIKEDSGALAALKAEIAEKG